MARAAELDLIAGRPHTFVPHRDVDTVVTMLAARLRTSPLALLPDVPSAQLAEHEAMVPRSVDPDIAALLFTSGSTGTAKLVAMPASSFEANARASAEVFGWRPGDRWLICLPLFHAGGLSILSRCWWAGTTAVLADPAPSFDPDAIAEQIARDRITLVSWVPTMLERMLDLLPSWTPPAHLRAVLVGGSIASAPLLDRARQRGIPVHDVYGMTETCSHILVDGVPVPGAEIRVDGDILAVRGPMVMRGYLGDGDIDGDWLVTRDRASYDGDRIVIHGRADDVIITGGENVDPARVEAQLIEIPGVSAACVFGEPDPEFGQRVACVLVASPSSPARHGETLRRALLGRLARHELPRRVAFLDALPLGPTGKPDRRAALAATRTARLSR